MGAMTDRRSHWDDEWIDCEPDYKFPGLCNTHGSMFHGESCEAVLIQWVREQLHKPWKYECECCTRIWSALDGDSDE